MASIVFREDGTFTAYNEYEVLQGKYSRKGSRYSLQFKGGKSTSGNLVSNYEAASAGSQYALEAERISDGPSGMNQIGHAVFRGCESLTYVEIPEGVAQIGNEAFAGCTNLAKLILPARLAKIGKESFVGCCSLEDVTIPESVVRIGQGAFKGCSKLTNITIPVNVAEIDEFVFWGCLDLSEVVIQNRNTTIGSNAFYGTRVQIPYYEEFSPASQDTAQILPAEEKGVRDKSASSTTGIPFIPVSVAVVAILVGIYVTVRVLGKKK